MIQIFFTALMWMFAPIPWAVSIIHVLIKNNEWRVSYIKAIVWITSMVVWVVLFLWLKSNYEVLFQQQFSTSVTSFLGIALIIISIVIEIVSTRSLGRGRILGSSEFGKSKDKLITSGIYKYARHPRYVEHPLWFVGFGLTFGYTSMLWFALYLFGAFAITSYFEEQELIRRYDKEYLNYKKKTPAFFIRYKSNK